MSRYFNPFFWLSRPAPAGISTTVGNADRAVLIDFRRFPAVIHAIRNPLIQRTAPQLDIRSGVAGETSSPAPGS